MEQACQTLLKVIFFGGAADGAIVDLESHKEKVKVGLTIYADSYFMDDKGRAVFYAKNGEGKMRKKFVESLFKNEGLF